MVKRRLVLFVAVGCGVLFALSASVLFYFDFYEGYGKDVTISPSQNAALLYYRLEQIPKLKFSEVETELIDRVISREGKIDRSDLGVADVLIEKVKPGIEILERAATTPECQFQIANSYSGILDFHSPNSYTLLSYINVWALKGIVLMDQDPEQSISIFAALVKIGNQWHQGTLFMRWEGSLIRYKGYVLFKRFFNGKHSREVYVHIMDATNTLQQFGPKYDFEQYKQHEPYWRISHIILRRIRREKDSRKQFEQNSFNLFFQAEAMRDILRIAAGTVVFNLDKGRLPRNIRDLVPGYLSEVPQNPFTGTSYTYSLQDERVVIHGPTFRPEGESISIPVPELP